ncbi:MAG: NAD-dependent epimerase/dehydratase family protein [Candidatus Hydrogenedentes bacterium]|nr:NAD-dependent epimerase/dehydratase family protein [Candidatus Hydrogenedentota bacterium]
MESVDQLEDVMTRPSPGLVEAMRALKGDIVILGVGGKMGPTLAMLAARAVEESGVTRGITAVSTFSQGAVRERLESCGIATHKADLLAPGAIDALPDAENVVYMIGRKFGSTGAEWDTWGTNVLATGLAARRYATARVVAFSSGNVYPFVPVDGGGATETTLPDPVGEYAMSGLGRERMWDYASHHYGTRVLHYRLNYAVELRYGVILDVAQKVWKGETIDVTMGYANCIWQGYANSVALQCLALATSPPAVLNVTGLERISIRDLATRMGGLLGKKPNIVGAEAPTALLSNATKCHDLFGPPDVSIDTLCHWIAHWIASGGKTLAKPTHFETRDGKF